MTFKIGSNTVVNNDRRGLFKKVNPGSYTQAEINALSKSEGDIVYNSTLNILQYWNGAEWMSMEGVARLTKLSGVNSTFYGDDGYNYAIYKNSGTLEVFGNGPVEVYLQAGGGGGGAGRYSGGGGAGGSKVETVYVSEGTYNVTVGAGGLRMESFNGYQTDQGTKTATRGGDSSVFGVTAKGGGSQINTKNGGCGAGGNEHQWNGGSGTTGQGYNGGKGNNDGLNESAFVSGGGGGIGGNGKDYTTQGGAGGPGKSQSQAQLSAWPISEVLPFSRWGGGGAGGCGYPWKSTASVDQGGRSYQVGYAASTNSGGGGGGGQFRQGTNYYGGAGGSGFITIRWKA